MIRSKSPWITVLWLSLLLLYGGHAWAQGCSESALHSEFYTDPSARGYLSCTTDSNLGGPTTDDICVQTKLNSPCTNNNACKIDNILTREQVLETIIDSTELDTLAKSTAPNDVARKSELDWLLNASPYNMAKSSWQQKWKNIFSQGNSPLTNAAIDAAKQKDAPRCQAVCSKGSSCSLSDVSLGLRGSP